jgi:NAD-dependent SIR2 family protein deacetylase
LSYNPTAVVDISLFSVNQFPYLEVRRPFILGTAEQRWKPTISHFFAEVLHKKGLLRRLYTQNIDGLDSNLEIEDGKIIHVHGSLSKIQCEFCKDTYPAELFREEVRTKIRNIYDPSDASAPKSSSNIYCQRCSKAGVKPATVMYGSALPKAWFRNIADDFPANVDLLIIAGTSLTVAPACNLVTMVKEGTPRLLVNNDMVGLELGLDFSGSREGTVDVFLQGECDQGFLFLCRELGWLEDLFACMDRMCPASTAALRQALETSRD